MRTQQSLNGLWERSVNGHLFAPQIVPFSALCVGESVVRTSFDARVAPRAALCFEGVAYNAEAYLNGARLGDMLPYRRYVFDVTDALKERGNALVVNIRDRGMKYGPTEGWENYGGILRGVYLEYTEKAYIEDAFWRAELTEDFRAASCAVLVRAHGAFALRATLCDRFGDAVAQTETPFTGEETDMTFSAQKPLLWSPESPNLYTLTIEALDESGNVTDAYAQKVGFKRFCAEGTRFMLNGAPYFLKGVCRHDMWGDEGMTLTDEQIVRDLKMIKAAGCNFVRLVHYPHDARVVAACDEIGLMISEESGLWWSDVTDPEVYAPALEVLKSTIVRDRSHVSVAFWLAFNECVLNDHFLTESTAICKRTDPTRMISGANCMTPEKTKTMFTDAGFDFYTYHPYGQDETTIMGGIGAPKPHFKLEEVYDILNDKPLLFTEWGGCHVEDNVYVFSRFLKNMLRAGRDGRLAGFSYWEWADIYEFGRGLPGCIDGVLFEGMVDLYRRPRAILNVFTRILGDTGALDDPEPQIVIHPFSLPQGAYTPLSLPRGADDGAWDRAIRRSEIQAGFRNKPRRQMRFGPVLPRELRAVGELPVSIPKGQPIVIETEWRAPVDAEADALYMIGLGTMPWGYPQYGQKGEIAGACELLFEDGETLALPLRNGEEVTGVIASAGPSRLDVVGARTDKAFSLSFDKNWEHYTVQLFRLPVPSGKRVKEIVLRYLRDDSALLLYGITAYRK